MTDHAVHRVHRLVGQDPRQSKQHVIEHRGNDAIAKVFCHRFDCGTSDTGFIQTLRVAPDNVSDRIPAGIEIRIKTDRHTAYVIKEVTVGDQHSNQNRLYCPDPVNTDSPKPIPEQPSEKHGTRHHKYYSENSGKTLSLLRRVRVVEGLLKSANEFSYNCNRMRYSPVYPIWISDDRINQECNCQNKIRLRCSQNKIRIRDQHEQILRANDRYVNKNHQSCEKAQNARTL